MAEVIQAVRPSVVNIYTTKKIKRPGMPFPFDDPFFRRFFGEEFGDIFERPREYTQTALGSGVIVDPSGTFLRTIMLLKELTKLR